MVEKRRPITLLPGVNQTDTLTKFFAATVDHLFQPESVEFLSGYIGTKPEYYDRTTDFYVGEPTKSRADYQLPVTAVSANQLSGRVTNIMFYDDFVNLLQFHGANTQNPSRLFEGEYWCWTPPVDLDQLLNFTQYYWVPAGPDPILLLSATDLRRDALGQTNFTYTGVWQLTSTGEIKDTPLAFTTGLVIQPTNDATVELDQPWVISGVGRNIQLCQLPLYNEPAWDIVGWDTAAWDGDETVYVKDYVTIGRSPRPTNQWSSNNRWYHQDVLQISGTPLLYLYQARAARPIIDFEPGLRLYDAGWLGRAPVTCVSSMLPNFLQTVVGSLPNTEASTIDGIPLSDGDTVLVTGDSDPAVNGRVYEVSGIATLGVVSLSQIGSAPILGDTLLSLQGNEFGNTQLWYDGSAWQIGQQRVARSGSDPIVYDAPLFDLFDSDGNSLADPSIYPSSSFRGNAIFAYQSDARVQSALDLGYDAALGFGPLTDQFGSYLFDNAIVTQRVTYLYNTTLTQIQGFYYYLLDAPTGSQHGNGWYKSPEPSRQYIFNDFMITQQTDSLLIDQQPDPYPGLLPSIYVTLIRSGVGQLLLQGTDYVVQDRTVLLAQSVIPGDRVTVRSWSRGIPQGNLGYYELPLNLTANANNQQVTSISQSQYLQQFEAIIGNQPGFIGDPLGSNNWRDTQQIRGLGFSILQHRAPLLKAMLLSSSNVTVGINSVSSDTDPLLAIQFAGRDYVRFYNRLISTLQTLWRNAYGAGQPPQQWLETAYRQINLGKTPADAWANSGPDGAQGRYTYAKSTAPTYVPPTSTRLGMAPAYQPMAYIKAARLWIQAHDGARMIMATADGSDLGTIADGLQLTTYPSLLTNPVAAAWLQFELDLFDNMPTAYQDPQAQLALDIRRYIPGKWRQGSYSRSEWLDITYPMFNRWVIAAQVDWRTNTTYALNDPFSWNYGDQTDQQGQTVPGNWQGMYRWFYDTDRPHTHPWEMLGFSQQPPWWTSEYGPAPWTNGNTYMWDDLAAGRIRQGPRAGIDPTWARPGLLQCIPVDGQGLLLPPGPAGCVTSLPSSTVASAEWRYGDGGPIETTWIYSNDYNFDTAAYSYLMKPAQFVEYNWDTLRQINAYSAQIDDQWIYADTLDRRSNSQLYVHRENPSSIQGNLQIPNESTLSYYGSGGLQHWISEYVVSKNLNVTQYLGNIMRGAAAQLAHQSGGFVSSNLYLTADSFGQIGYTSQIIPSENVSLYLYRSASIRTSFYTGVIITQMRDGYRVIGYDGVDPWFTIIPSNVYGSKSTIIVGNERVTWYKQGIDWAQQIPYGTVLPSKQEVFDFLVGLQRYQQLQGWVFDTFNQDGNYVYDWVQSGKEFLFWSQGSWANGNFIAVSPLANGARYVQGFGTVQFVSGLVSGTYPVLDKTGSSIDGQNLEVLRYDDSIAVNTTNTQSIYGLRLFATTLESAILIDNTTSFDDTIYDPLFNLQQARLRLYAYRTNDWDGRVDAPGYFLYQDGTSYQWNLVPNFEKTANDFRKYYNIDQPKNFTTVDPVTGNLVVSGTELATTDVADISKLAKHQIGYQNRPYLANLLLEESTEFQFYQGFIRQKGSRSAIDKLLRNNAIVPVTSDFQYYEEYAFRDSRYGATALNIGTDFIIPQNQYRNDPQQITVFGRQGTDREIDGVITLIPNDPLFVVPPPSFDNHNTALFPLRPTAAPDYTTDLPNSGYVLQGETTYTVTNATALSTLWSTNSASNVTMQNGDTVWQLINQAQGWMVYEFSQANVNITNTSPSIGTGNPTVINTTGNVGVQIGDLVVLSGIANVSINGTWTVSSVTGDGNSFVIPTSTFDIGSGGVYYVYKPLRFHDEQGRDENPPFNGWLDGSRAYVDQTTGDPTRWTVYLRVDGQWIAERTANRKVNAPLMLSSSLYSLSKGTLYANLQYYDPGKGIIPTQASRYINHRSVYDPAAYNNGDATVYPLVSSRAWGPEHVGVTWWDLSSVRYLDYEIGSTGYRWQNWGSIAPGTTVDVYEWVQSPVAPSNWATYVSSGNDFTQFGLNYAPSGTVLNSDNPAWSQFTEFTSSAATSQTFYYFWVKNAYTLPLPPDRSLTTVQISSIIDNPTSNGIMWYAAIDDRNIIVSNVGHYLHSFDTVLSLTYTYKPNQQNTYTEWELVRQNDPASLPSQPFWNKLTDSLTGKDGLQNIVPDAFLSAPTRYGVLIRPRQTMYVDRQQAVKIWVDNVNYKLSEILLVTDINRSSWVTYFDSAEPPPTADYTVGTLASMRGLGNTIPDGSSILVLGGADTNGLWTLFSYSWNGGNNQFTRTLVQSYNTPLYWQYVDWYQDDLGITSSTIPNYTVPDLAGRSAYAGIEGVLVKVTNSGTGSWALYQWYLGQWITVGYENGTVQILSSIYDGLGNTMQFGTTPFDSVTWDIYPWHELQNIINGVVNVILAPVEVEVYNSGTEAEEHAGYLNDLWFAMVNHALVEQSFVDWVFKTSYITLHGFNVPLSSSPQLYKPDLASSIIEYIDEIKPYHVKVREFVSGRSWTDNARVHATDFDNPANVNVLTNSAYSNAEWQANYQTNAQLIRTLKLQLLFDRVASKASGDPLYDSDLGAFTRIQQYYAPGADMIRKDDPNLIPGSDYRGIIVDAIGFNYRPGWSLAPWDAPTGWDASASSFTNYLDLLIQGGIAPVYDLYYGTGSKRAFKLSRAPQSPSALVVWSDNLLRDYGVDFAVPSFILNLTLTDGGQYYEVGEQLLIAAVPAVTAARITVTAVDVNGAILSWTLDDRGAYDVWPKGVVGIEYPPYHAGLGSGAEFTPTWGGDTLVFVTAPSSNASPNIFVLYTGDTFQPAPTNALDVITDGNRFVQPNVEQDHPEERYVLRLPSSLRMDVLTEANGGAPQIVMRVYQLDGQNDHFDLGTAPMDTSAVLAQIDGRMLNYGLANDFIINWATNQMVFLDPPQGKTLQIMTITAGGTGLNANAAFVVSPGSGYQTGDFITLAGGSTIANDACILQVTAVTAVAAAITAGGQGYRVGDQLTLPVDNSSVDSDITAVVVTAVDANGSITGISISEPGSYLLLPDPMNWLTDGAGLGVDLAVLWGVSTAIVHNQGFYSLKPIDPVGQQSSSGNGTAATFALRYTSLISSNSFIADGLNNTYRISTAVPNDDINLLFVTQNGLRQINGINAQITADGQDITIVPTPGASNVITITQFTTANFSVVNQQLFNTNNSIYAYVLQYPPYSTLPPYLSTTVSVAGHELPLPPMDVYIGTGYTNSYAASYVPIDTTLLQVYVGDYRLSAISDYTISGKQVILYEAPMLGATVALVVIDPDYGYSYAIQNNTLIFPLSTVGWGYTWDDYYGWSPLHDFRPINNEELSVVTYSEDASYEFRSIDLTGPCSPLVPGNKPGVYVLPDSAEDQKLSVWLNGQQSTLLYDYNIVQVDSIPGWDITDWSVYPWQEEHRGDTAVQYSNEAGEQQGVTVTIQYMHGRSERPAIAWRTITDGQHTVSTALDINATTTLLMPCFAWSDELLVADITVLPLPSAVAPGTVWIGYERIDYWQVEAAPTSEYPTAGRLKQLQRGTFITPSGNVSTLFDTIFYDGDAATQLFATASGGVTPGGNVVVYVNDHLQVSLDTAAQIAGETGTAGYVGMYDIVTDPQGEPPGQYVRFVNAPHVGWKNVRLATPRDEVLFSGPSHPAESEVIAAGPQQTIPGGYSWQASPDGLQYSQNAMARFLKMHPAS